MEISNCCEPEWAYDFMHTWQSHKSIDMIDHKKKLILTTKWNIIKWRKFQGEMIVDLQSRGLLPEDIESD